MVERTVARGWDLAVDGRAVPYVEFTTSDVEPAYGLPGLRGCAGVADVVLALVVPHRVVDVRGFDVQLV